MPGRFARSPAPAGSRCRRAGTLRAARLALRSPVPATAAAGKKIIVSARVTNKGKRDGEEVVQLYISHENKTIKAPLKALKGFRRIFLKAGESKTIQFTLTAQDLSVADATGAYKIIKGKTMISIGGSQPGEKNKTTSNTVKGIVTVN